MRKQPKREGQGWDREVEKSVSQRVGVEGEGGDKRRKQDEGRHAEEQEETREIHGKKKRNAASFQATGAWTTTLVTL